ncbi:GroES-like protein [Calocera viscosa TUFC12733]|uniref:GroES-like protein n=1 Tax=Calocera viscosa (strain TUFC12733) TaxID=1330018 RepID=A0A167H5N8_CALVF|nr:GroES-like protein [Calocera viscosa TUFC12733]
MRGLQIVHFSSSPSSHPYILNPRIPVPPITSSQLLIKIAVAGYCHTETMVARGEFARMALHDPLPQIPGHEPTGWVAAVGSEVGGEWEVGMRVGCLNYRNPCGACEECKAGRVLYCPNMQMAGVTADGAMAEYMVADPLTTVRLPPSLTFESAAPLFCAGATIYASLLKASLSPGQAVAIVGVGALGHLGVQFAKVMGLRVVAVDSRSAPLELVQTLRHPPDITLNSSTTPVSAALAQLPFQVDASIIATDALPAYDYALNLTRRHGTVVVVGQPGEPIPVQYGMLVFRDLTLRGSVLSSPEVCREMIKVFTEHELEVRTKVYALEEVDALIEDTHREGMAGKMVVRVAEVF